MRLELGRDVEREHVRGQLCGARRLRRLDRRRFERVGVADEARVGHEHRRVLEEFVARTRRARDRRRRQPRRVSPVCSSCSTAASPWTTSSSVPTSEPTSADWSPTSASTPSGAARTCDPLATTRHAATANAADTDRSGRRRSLTVEKYRPLRHSARRGGCPRTRQCRDRRTIPALFGLLGLAASRPICCIRGQTQDVTLGHRGDQLRR